MNRNYLRVAALAFFLYLSAAPVAIAAPRKERDSIGDPGHHVVRIVKRIKTFLRGFTSQDDGMTPPVPKP